MHRDSIGCKGASNRPTRLSGDTFPDREPQKGIYAASVPARARSASVLDDPAPAKS